MDSKTFSIFTFLIFLQWELVFSGWFDQKKWHKYESAAIPVSDFVESLRQEPIDSFALMQLECLLMVSSFGDRLYNLSADVSAECQKTIRAGVLMMGKLAVGEEVNSLFDEASVSVWRDLKSGPVSQEHPAELFCRKIEKQFEERSNLSSWFVKAKKDAAEYASVGRRPPYFRTLVRPNELILKMVEKWDVPEFAKLMAHTSFLNELEGFYLKKRRAILARTCQTLAKKEQFENAIQGAYEKAISDVLPELVNDRVKKFNDLIENQKATEVWWIPNLMKGLYGHISKDPILKKEVDSTAAVIGKGASQEELDFSKL